MDEFDKEPNEAHDGESNSGGNGNLLELWKKSFLEFAGFPNYIWKCTFFVGFGAPLDETNGVFGKLPQGFNGLSDLIHVSWRRFSVIFPVREFKRQLDSARRGSVFRAALSSQQNSH